MTEKELRGMELRLMELLTDDASRATSAECAEFATRALFRTLAEVRRLRAQPDVVRVFALEHAV